MQNLIESRFFYLKISWVHVFCSNFSQVCMFCDDNFSQLVSESTQPGGVLNWTIVDNLTKNPKVETYYYIERYKLF